MAGFGGRDFIDHRRNFHAQNMARNAQKFGAVPSLTQSPQNIPTQTGPFLAPTRYPSEPIEPNNKRFWEDPESFFSRAINFLSSGAFAVGGAIEGVKDVARGDVRNPADFLSSASKPLQGLGRGLSGKAGTWPSEALGPEITKFMGTPALAAASEFGVLDKLKGSKVGDAVAGAAGKTSELTGGLAADIMLDPFVYPGAVKGIATGVGKVASAAAPKTAQKTAAAAARAREAAKGKFTPRAKQEASEALDLAPSISESLATDAAPVAARTQEALPTSPLPKAAATSSETNSSRLVNLFERAPDDVFIPEILPKLENITEGIPRFARATVNQAKGTISPYFATDLNLSRNVRTYRGLDNLEAPFTQAVKAPATRTAEEATEAALSAATTPARSSETLKASQEGFNQWIKSDGGDTVIESLHSFEQAGLLSTTADGIRITTNAPDYVQDAANLLNSASSEVAKKLQRLSINSPVIKSAVNSFLGPNASVEDFLKLANQMKSDVAKFKAMPDRARQLERAAKNIEKAVQDTYTDQVRAINQITEGLNKSRSTTKTVTKATETLSESAQKDATKRWTRFQGEQRKEWLRDLKNIVTDEADYKWLRDARTYEQYMKRVGELKSRKSRVPIFEEIMITSEYPPPGVDLSLFKWSKKTPTADQQRLLERGIEAVNRARIENPTVPEIISKYATGEEAAASRALARKQTEEALLNTMDGSTIRAVQNALDEQFIAPRTTHPHKTLKHQTARDSTELRKGTGKQTDAWNSMGQSEVWRSLTRDFSRSSLGETSGWERATKLAEFSLKRMREAENYLESKGVWGILSKTDEGIPVTLTDILETLYVHQTGFAKRRIFSNVGLPGNAAGHTLPTDIAHIFEVLLSEIPRTSKPEEVAKAFNKVFNNDKVMKIAKDVINNSTESRGLTTYSLKSREMVRVSAEDAAKVFEEVVTAVTDPAVVSELWGKATARAARYGIELNDQIGAISRQTIDDIVQVMSSPRFSQGEFLETLAKQGELIDANAVSMREGGQNVFEASPIAARKVVEDGLATKVLDPHEIGIAESLFEVNKTAEKAVREGIETFGKLTEATNQSAQKAYEKIVTEALDLSGVTNSGEAIEQALDRGIFRALFPNKSKADGLIGGMLRLGDRLVDGAGTTFLAHYNNPTVQAVTRDSMTVSRGFTTDIGNRMTHAIQTFGEDTLNQAFRNIQAGNKAAGLPDEVMRATEELNTVLGMIFDGGDAGGLGVFLRNGIDLEGVNSRIFQVTKKAEMSFDLTAARLSAESDKAEDIMTALTNQWKTWDIDNPMRFISDMRVATASAVTDSVIGREAVRLGRDVGMVSNTPKKNWVRITDSKNRSMIAPYMQGYYFHPEFAAEIQTMDKILNTSLDLGGPVGKFWQKNLDPITASWKVGQTIYNPGHHVRNLVGDVTLTYMAEGVSGMGAYHKAMKVMGQRGSYDGFDALKALDAMGKGKRYTNNLDKASKEVLVKGSVGGKKFELNADQISSAMRGRGGLLNYKIREDLLEAGMVIGNQDVASANRFADRIRQVSPFKGKARETVGQVSEARDNYVRIAHWLQIMENPKYAKRFNNLEDLMDFATSRVKKWHPDGSELSKAEAKYARRVFLFYSWTRKAIPLVVESALTQPGRFTSIPKATYHMAETMGMNPESISNQFPSAGLYPDFLKDGMRAPLFEAGGDEYAAAPGFATNDVLSVLSNPKSESIGMLTPFAKVPFELYTGRRIETGTEIDDVPQYVESQIPFVSRFANITGVSPLGSINKMARGQGLIDEQKAVERGDKEVGINPSNLISYLTGSGLQKVNTPAFRNIARTDKARERRKEREAYQKGGWFQ